MIHQHYTMPEKKKSKNKYYFLAIVIFTLLFFYLLITGRFFLDFQSVLLFFVFLIILFASFFKTAETFLFLIFLAPVMIGLDGYQINIGAFFENLGVKDLYINPFSLLCLLITFLGAVELLKNGKRIFQIPLMIIIPIAIILNSVSLFNAGYLDAKLVFWLYFLAPFFAYFLGFLLLGSKGKYFKLLITVILSAIIPLVVASKQLIMKHFLFEADTALPRLQGTFPHSNTFGSFLSVVATVYLVTYLSASFTSKKRNKNKKYWLIPFLILLLFLVLTYSRVALAGLVVAVIILALVKVDFRKPASWGAGGILGILLLFERTRERLFSIFKREMFDSLRGRLEIWDIALFKFRTNIFSGYGIGSFEEVIKEARGRETGNVYPHNDSIRFLLEGGIIGFMGYVLYMLGALFYAFKSYLKYPKARWKKKFFKSQFFLRIKLLGACSLILFVAMLVTSFLEAPSMDFTYQIIAWTILGSWLGTFEKRNKKSLKI